MARGTAVAQIKVEGPKVAIPYRASPAQVTDLDSVQKAEGGEAVVTRSQVVEHLVGRGTALYWAVESVGPERFDALMAQTPGATEREREIALVKELIRRGVEALEAEHGKRGR